MERILAAVLLTIAPFVSTVDAPAPGDGLGLDTTRVARSAARSTGGGTSTSRGIPPAPFGIGVAGSVAALGTLARARRRRDSEPFFVLVHGDGGSGDDFDELLESMGVDPRRAAAFDYRTVARDATSEEASRTVPTAEAAVGLDAFIRAVATRHANVYSIHHSRGGAVGVEMIAAIDSGERPRIDGYQGAALLDPAIGTGGLGWLQRMGVPLTRVPDNGGFDPVRCDASGCRDIREHLGDVAGVEVIAVRNPDALVTNFTDRPAGLRTFDLVDDGADTAIAQWWNLPGVVRRVFEAHGSVLHHHAVADCIVAESTLAGSCVWKGHRRLPKVWWGRGNALNLRR